MGTLYTNKDDMVSEMVDPNKWHYQRIGVNCAVGMGSEWPRRCLAPTGLLNISIP